MLTIGAVYINKQLGTTDAAWNWPSKNKALIEAKKYCTRNNTEQTGQCQAVVSLSNGCISVYWLPITKNTSWGYDAIDTHNVRTRAAQGCREVGGKECKEIRTFCTMRYY